MHIVSFIPFPRVPFQPLLLFCQCFFQACNLAVGLFKSMSWLAHLASCKRETLRSIERRIFWWIFPFNLTLSRQLHLFPKRPFQWCKFSTCPPFLSVLFTGNLHISWHIWQGAGEKKGRKVHFLASVRSIQKISNSCHGIKSWHEQALFGVTDV